MFKTFLLRFLGLFLVSTSVWAAVEINSADQAELDGIAGIGPATSKAILEERKKNGNFRDWSDLEQRVRGIGGKNSVKLSAAGLVINGQSLPSSPESGKATKPVKARAAEAKTEPVRQ